MASITSADAANRFARQRIIHPSESDPMSKSPDSRFALRAIPAMIAAAFSMYSVATSAQEALEQVVVTARKQAENLQMVPISAISLDSSVLEKTGVVTLSDLNDGSVPGLNLAPYPGSSDFFFPTFRGITTNTAFISAPNPIAVHLNGVYLSQLVGLNNPAADLERIEVLKGPQGVLSGRNATGGVLNLYTAKPDLAIFGFKQQLSFAQRDQYLSKTVVNLPLGTTVAAKIAYLHDHRGNEGVSNSAPGGPKFGLRDSDAARFDLRWKPVKSVTVDYGYDYSLAKDYDTPSQCLYPAPAVLANQGTGDPRIAAFVAGCSPQKLTSLYYPYPLQKNRNVAQGHTLQVEWEASPEFTLRSITGYRKVDTRNNYNYGAYAGAADVRSDSGPLLVPGTPFDGTEHPVLLVNSAYSQEFDFLGQIGKTLRYTAGLYFSHEKGYQSSGPNAGMYLPGGGGAAGVDFAMVDAKGLHSSINDSRAVFAQLTWRPEMFADKLEIVPGVRYTRDHRRADGWNTGWTTGYVIAPTGPGAGTLLASVPIAAPGVGFTSAIGDKTWTKTTPAISFNYIWNDRLMTYLKYAEGYTSGGFDPISGPATAAAFVNGFKPETLKSIEGGLKAEFLDRRLRTNLAVFQSKFTDEQKSVALPSGGWKTENIGRSTYSGAELDVTAAVTSALRVTFNYATLAHKYTQWIDPTTGVDVTNLRKLIVPKNDYTLSVDYRFPSFGLPGQLDGTLSVSHRDRSSTPLNLSTPNVELYSTTPAFSVVNGRLALSRIHVGPGEGGDLTVALWGKNLLDKKYLNLAYQGWVTAGSGSWGDPRTFGLDLVYRY